MRENDTNLTPAERAAKQQQLLDAKREKMRSDGQEKNKPVKIKVDVEKEKSQKQLLKEQRKKEAQMLKEQKKRSRQKAMQMEMETSEMDMSVKSWFLNICWLKIPFFGFFYALHMARSKKTPAPKKAFAKAYFLYRVLVLTLAVCILIVLYVVALNFIDSILAYVK